MLERDLLQTCIHYALSLHSTNALHGLTETLMAFRRNEHFQKVMLEYLGVNIGLSGQT